MTITRSSSAVRRALGGALLSTALLGVAALPQTAAAKTHHKPHHHHAQRNAAPSATCEPGDMRMVGKGKEARLYVCVAGGTWTEAVYAVSENGQTHTVNAGRA